MRKHGVKILNRYMFEGTAVVTCTSPLSGMFTSHSAPYTKWIRCQLEPMTRSTYAFCHGEPGAVRAA